MRCLLEIRFTLVLALVVVTAAPAFAQRARPSPPAGPLQLGFDTLHALPPESFPPEAALLADTDGDGDLDLLLLPEGEARKHLYRNDGNGIFRDASERLPGSLDGSRAGALGDVDADGDLDLVLGNTDYAIVAGQQDRLWLNDGTGTFLDATPNLPPDDDATTALGLADFDGDGDLDLVVANEGDLFELDQNRLALNDGTGVFADATGNLPAALDATFDLDVADFDGDGDLDVLVGKSPPRLYVNDGNALFTQAATGMAFYEVAAVGDVDGDLDPDVYTGHEGGLQNRLYLRAGAGFVDATASLPVDADRTHAVALADVDGDGDLDALSANGVGEANRLYRNDGGGTFADDPASLPAMLADRSAALALGDVDGDADLDLLVGADDQDRLLLNDGAGAFGAEAEELELRDRTASLALLDVDGDHDLDLLVGNSPASTAGGFVTDDRLYVNDGAGGFTLSPHSPPSIASSRGTYAIAVGDVDLDGIADAFLGHSAPTPAQRGNRLLLGDGNGALVEASGNLPPHTDETFGVALGDVDGDGDLDAATGNGLASPAQNRLYRNDGTGVFADATASLPAKLEYTRAVDLGDIDGDGDLDLLFANGRSGAAGRLDDLYENDGTGTFGDASVQLPAFLEMTFDFAFGDVDADGDLDLLEGNYGQQFSRSAQNRLYLNDGAGLYADATNRLPVAQDVTTTAALLDVDADGDLDAWFGNVSIPSPSPSAQDRLYRNDGAGQFGDATALLPAAALESQALAFGDLDRDGDLDCLVGTARSSSTLEEQPLRNRILWNTARQLAARGLARLGKPLRFELHGPARGSWTLLGPGGLAGSGRLDASGRAACAVSVPPSPALVGVTLAWSAFVGPPFALLRETTRITAF